jgi:hypothetical protein
MNASTRKSISASRSEVRNMMPPRDPDNGDNDDEEDEDDEEDREDREPAVIREPDEDE